MGYIQIICVEILCTIYTAGSVKGTQICVNEYEREKGYYMIEGVIWKIRLVTYLLEWYIYTCMYNYTHYNFHLFSTML